MPAGARFLVNPGARRGADALERVNRLRTLAGRAGAGFVVSRGAADLAEQARRAAEDGIERLLVAGGDGSMHHAVQGLAGTSCALGVIPMGSGNDLAAVLGAPRDLEAAVQAALTGPIRRMDLIRMGETYSASYVGLGFDSEVTRVANQVTLVRGPLIYPYAVFRTLAAFRPPFLRITHDEGTFEGRVMFVTLANIDRFGGGMRIAPMAALDDGMLDLVIVKEVSKLTLLSVFPKVYSGKHVGHPAVAFIRTRKVEITADRELDVYGGGELIRALPEGQSLGAEIVPGGLGIVGPPQP
jgi:diacylglycerol kinase (ATP)